MGVFDDVGRIYDASKDNPRPGLIDGIKQAADAAEEAQEMKANLAATGGVPQGVNGQSFNPFENMQGMAAATRGTGTIAKIEDTGEKFDDRVDLRRHLRRRVGHGTRRSRWCTGR